MAFLFLFCPFPIRKIDVSLEQELQISYNLFDELQDQILVLFSSSIYAQSLI